MPERLPDAALRQALAISVDAVICVDAEQRIQFFNDGAARTFGYDEVEILGEPLDRLIPARFRHGHKSHMRRFGESDSGAQRMGERGEIRGLRKDGTEFPAEASIGHIKLPHGHLYSVVLRDVTERREIEEVNTQLVRNLRNAVTARDEMLGVVSHDLRNPVNAVKMLAAAIVRAGDREMVPLDVLQHAGVMQDAAIQMDTLIQDLLDVTRIESGRLQVSPQPVALRALVEGVVETLSPLAHAGEVVLKIECPKRLPKVDADPDRVMQLLSNLIGNGIKYTPRGGSVTISAEAQPEDIKVVVADTGVGISADELPRIFDRFWQSKRTNRSGAGLGLNIARGIVRAHGGRIWVESTEGAGTKVHCTLPRASR
ncbi:MAG: PAS domain-containing sensor histidine kinase [Gemmatimonadetes bacterium]|nr:PAS domain-containing sensor histidine kinase [Gemmatimonadota bacterium]